MNKDNIVISSRTEFKEILEAKGIKEIKRIMATFDFLTDEVI